MARQLDKEGKRVQVASGTAVKVLDQLERPESDGFQRLMKVEVLAGPSRGFIGWCPDQLVVTSLQDPADRDAAEAEGLWRTAQQLEKQGKTELALKTYQDIVRLLPNTPRTAGLDGGSSRWQASEHA